MNAPRPSWQQPQPAPVWVPAMLVIVAIVAAVLGFAVASAPSVCTPGIWL